MTATVNFDALPRAGDRRGELLAGRLANYADRGAFAQVRDWSRSQVAGTGGRVLEVGPGLGETLAALAGVGADVTYLDASEFFASRVAAITAGTVGDVTAMPYRDGAFRAVLADRVLHHVAGLEAALVELARVLEVGGRLVVTLPDLTTLRADAPSASFAKFAAATATDRVVTARADAAQAVAGAAHWDVVEQVRVTVTDRDDIEAYVRPAERIEAFAAQGYLDAGDVAALSEWAAGTERAWAFELVGLALTPRR